LGTFGRKFARTDQNLSAEDAARRLGVSADWLYKTKLPFKVKIGRRVLFSATGLEKWNRQRLERG
jgi:predicted DNA-binding transcriptional regulator AlpA